VTVRADLPRQRQRIAVGNYDILVENIGASDLMPV
jgi:hypothetical protein